MPLAQERHDEQQIAMHMFFEDVEKWEVAMLG